MFMCVSWFDLVVSTCQVISYKDSAEDDYTRCEDYPQKAQFEESVCVYFCAYFLFLYYYAFISPPGPTQYVFGK